jgi:hypothetical protein
MKAMIMEYTDEEQTKWEVLCHQYIKNKRTKGSATLGKKQVTIPPSLCISRLGTGTMRGAQFPSD